MIAKEVLQLVSQYIGDTELLDTQTLGGTTEPDDQQKSKLNMLLSCLNDTIQSLALMYFPLKYEQSVKSSDGIYSFSSLEKPIVDILKLVDECKNDVKYAFFPTHFEAKSGTLNIVYTYMPDYVHDFDADLEVNVNKVSKRLLALGTTSRYFMFVGMYNDADAWNTMFEKACLVASRPKNNVVVKQRWWI